MLADALGVEVRFKPSYTIAELINSVKLALSYLMLLDDNGYCPFFDKKERKCRIHSLYKPLTCRCFPYLPRVIKYAIEPELKMVDFTVEFVVSNVCPAIKTRFTDDELILIARNQNLARKYMPLEYLAAQESIRVRKTYVAILMTLWKKGLVELRSDSEVRADLPVVNAFDFIRDYMPHITLRHFVPNIDEILKRVKDQNVDF